MFRYFFGNQFDAQTRRSSSLGSGVIVSDRGYVLTNHHVIEAADEIEVALSDTRRSKARVVGTDPASGEEITAQNGRFGPYGVMMAAEGVVRLAAAVALAVAGVQLAGL